MNDPFIDEPLCECGHSEDEHEDTSLAPCAADDCDCPAYCECL